MWLRPLAGGGPAGKLTQKGLTLEQSKAIKQATDVLPLPSL